MNSAATSACMMAIAVQGAMVDVETLVGAWAEAPGMALTVAASMVSTPCMAAGGRSA